MARTRVSQLQAYLEALPPMVHDRLLTELFGRNCELATPCTLAVRHGAYKNRPHREGAHCLCLQHCRAADAQLTRYIGQLAAEGWDRLSTLRTAEASDLEELGIPALHVRQILARVAAWGLPPSFDGELSMEAEMEALASLEGRYKIESLTTMRAGPDLSTQKLGDLEVGTEITVIAALKNSTGASITLSTSVAFARGSEDGCTIFILHHAAIRNRSDACGGAWLDELQAIPCRETRRR
eukprot:SAG11_NODE_1358_length_5120_cov_1.838080_5_plen_239_part_00